MPEPKRDIAIGEQVLLHPTVATIWDGPSHQGVKDPTSAEGLEKLRNAAERGDTVWIGCFLKSLTKDEEAWFTGTFDIWSSMENPVVSWQGMATVLDAVGLPVPAPMPEPEPPPSTFLRALPYVYMRGVFGTARDALQSEEVAKALSGREGDERLTAFPMVGFQPAANNKQLESSEYVTLRSAVGVVANTVLTVRFPDLICAPDTGGSRRSPGEPISLVLPRRFLPLRTMPGGRELAEAVGIHQATTLRGVSGQVRAQLGLSIGQMENLRRGFEDKRDIDLRGSASEAAEEADNLSEVARQLEHQLGQVFRRMGVLSGEAPEAAAKLTPAEVERRYQFALDEARALYQECRLTSHIIREAISDRDQGQSHRFQTTAATLASIVVIPTLLAGIFGANVRIPSEKSAFGFSALVTVIVLLVCVSLYTMRVAQRHHWNPPTGKLLFPAVATALIVGTYAGFLVLS